MPTFVALLRGINVGKAKRLPMADLRALLVKLDYTNVATLLNSGNAVFRAPTGTSARHAERIAAAIVTDLNLDVPVIVKSVQELQSVIVENALASSATNHSQLLVVFAQQGKTLAEMSAMDALVVAPEQLLLGKNAAYLHCANGILNSKAAEALLGKSGKFVTTRNWSTVLKLRALASNPDA